MRIGAKYSHLNGEEYLQVHHSDLWEDVREVIAGVDASVCRTKKSKEKKMQGKMLYSPKDMNAAFWLGLKNLGWAESRNSFVVADDEKLLRDIHGLPTEAQREAIEETGREPTISCNETDFVKERVAVEVHFGKCAFMAHDIFAKHLGFYVADMIDVGIEILPMKELEQEMSSGVPYYERDLLNIVQQGRGVPVVPLVLLGVLP